MSTNEDIVLNYGIIGTGRASLVHANILLSQGQHIVAIGDEVNEAMDYFVEHVVGLGGSGRGGVVVPSRRQAAPPVLPRFSSAEEMVAAHKRGDIKLDAAVITSHTPFHARDSLPFVQAGIKVYAEKPLTASLPPMFEFLRTLGPESNFGAAQVQVGLQRRYDDAICYAKSLVDAGKIGKIREIRCCLRDQFPPPKTYSSPGLILDMMVHITYEALFFLNGEMPNQVWALQFSAIGYDSPIDEGANTAFVQFTTKSGVVGRLDGSRTFSTGYLNCAEIIGTAGVIQVGFFRGYSPATGFGDIPVELWKPDGELDREASKTFHMPKELEKPFQAEFMPRFKTAFENAHRQFRADFRTGSAFKVTPLDCLQAQVFTQAAHISATKKNGGMVRVEDLSKNLDEYEKFCAAEFGDSTTVLSS